MSEYTSNKHLIERTFFTLIFLFFTLSAPITSSFVTLASLQCCLPGLAEAGAPAGVLAQGLVSRAGRAGGRTGGLAAAGTEKAGAVPFTTADKRQKLVRASLCVG